MKSNFVFQERLTRMTVVFFNGRFEKQLTQKLFWAVFVFRPTLKRDSVQQQQRPQILLSFKFFLCQNFYLPVNFSRAVSHCRASQVGGTTIQRRRPQTALS